ncbi:MAG: alkaline phosphatase family protein [Clostridia bacterium]|nr:alkaline phosphatase family protein [Clostridia bacterium]
MKSNIIYPNYKNSILGIPNSILKYCGIEPLHETNAILDEYLRKDYKNVVVMLFDGMGTDCLQKNLAKENSIFHNNIKDELSSVYLCTTTAATTSMITAQSPIEHGWLGWSCYFDELGKLVNIFINDDGTISDGKPLTDYHIAGTYMPFKSIFELVNEKGSGIQADSVSRYGTILIESHVELINKTIRLCNDSERRFIYTYWHQPDSMMHISGCYDKKVKDVVAEIQNSVQAIQESVEDTLIIVTADHGLRDCRVKVIDHYPEIKKYLRLPTGLEPRCNSYYIKEGMIDDFVMAFEKEFSDEFVLYTKEEFLQKGFLGEGTPHKKSLDFLGDIIAVATGDIGLWHDIGADKKFKALHAGMTDKEMMVPLIVLET